jgi:hypothetical protein
MVTSAANALLVLLEHAGLLGDLIDSQLAAYAAEGLAIGGWRAQVCSTSHAPYRPDREATACEAMTSSHFHPASTDSLCCDGGRCV